MQLTTLLDHLPARNRESLYSKSQIVKLYQSEILSIQDQIVEFVYFPISGFISLFQELDDFPHLEVGMIGHEGMLGSEIALGMTSNPFGSIVQGAGSALKVSVKDFQSELLSSKEVSDTTFAYISVRLKQLGNSIACEHFHEVRPRLARWLLMSQDRAESSKFALTHEFIALMLGVRRAGISIIANNFKQNGIIEYSRGFMNIVDRARLEKEACSCYQDDKQIYKKYLHIAF